MGIVACAINSWTVGIVWLERGSLRNTSIYIGRSTFASAVIKVVVPSTFKEFPYSALRPEGLIYLQRRTAFVVVDA